MTQMKTAIILHGTCDEAEYFSDEYPSLSNSHWIPWLQKQFLLSGYSAHTPEVPTAYLPSYSQWKLEFERYPISDDTILVGHSCGGGFLLRWLSETKRKVARVVLVAPWLDPEKSKAQEFFNFEIDSTLTERADIHLLESSNDADDIQASIRIIRKALPSLHWHLFKDYGHFCFSDMKTIEFPELRRIALKGSKAV